MHSIVKTGRQHELHCTFMEIHGNWPCSRPTAFWCSSSWLYIISYKHSKSKPKYIYIYIYYYIYYIYIIYIFTCTKNLQTFPCKQHHPGLKDLNIYRFWCGTKDLWCVPPIPAPSKAMWIAAWKVRRRLPPLAGMMWWCSPVPWLKKVLLDAFEVQVWLQSCPEKTISNEAYLD